MANWVLRKSPRDFPSEDQHRVPVAEKTVLTSDGFGVDFFHPGNAIRAAGRQKSRDQAEQGGAGLVEIGDERVDAAKSPRRVDKYSSLRETGRLGRFRVAREKIFHRAHR